MLRYLIVFFTILFTACERHDHKVGLVIPLEHQAMIDITKGLEDTLTTPKTKLLKKNAMGDMNIQQSILRSFKDCDLIVTIGTAATQQARALYPHKSIIGLAARADSFKSQKGLYLVDDEISPAYMIDFIASNFKHIKTLSLVYSNNEKILPEVAEVQKLCKQKGINLQPLAIQTMADIYQVVTQIKGDAILILKDHLVVSSIATLMQKKLPIFASDEGSVKEGADFAIGVTESAIGTQGGRIVSDLLSGKSVPSSIKVRPLKLFLHNIKQAITTPYEKEEVSHGNHNA